MSDYHNPPYTAYQGNPRRTSREHLFYDTFPARSSTVDATELLDLLSLGAADRAYADRWHGVRRWGRHKVAGVLYRDGVPHHGKVVLLERRGLRLVRETTSNEAGEYLFDQVPSNTYLVMAFDAEHFWERPDLNATITDWVVSEPRHE